MPSLGMHIGFLSEQPFRACDVQGYMQEQGVNVRSLNITGMQLMAQSTLAPSPAPDGPAAAPVATPPGNGGGLDLATIGKGIGERLLALFKPLPFPSSPCWGP